MTRRIKNGGLRLLELPISSSSRTLLSRSPEQDLRRAAWPEIGSGESLPLRDREVPRRSSARSKRSERSTPTSGRNCEEAPHWRPALTSRRPCDSYGRPGMTGSAFQWKGCVSPSARSTSAGIKESFAMKAPMLEAANPRPLPPPPKAPPESPAWRTWSVIPERLRIKRRGEKTSTCVSGSTLDAACDTMPFCSSRVNVTSGALLSSSSSSSSPASRGSVDVIRRFRNVASTEPCSSSAAEDPDDTVWHVSSKISSPFTTVTICGSRSDIAVRLNACPLCC